jgi:hypothetical protein
MIWPEQPGPATDSSQIKPELSERRSAWLKQDFFDSYVRWREACEEVRVAYERWDSSDRRDRGLAFAAFCAALDREGHAASVHADSARAVRADSAG